MNKVFLIGRLTKDPELKFTQGAGTAVASFTLAVERSFKNADGTKEADFLNVVCWNKLAELIANNIEKGRQVAVFGEIRTRNYEGQDGKKVYVTEIVASEVKFLDKPKGGQTQNSGASNGGFIPVEDDGEIPFN